MVGGLGFRLGFGGSGLGLRPGSVQGIVSSLAVAEVEQLHMHILV